MACYQKTLRLSTHQPNEVQDITAQVQQVVAASGVTQGLCAIYTPHATAAIAINENADPAIGTDLLAALRKLIRDHDGWLHDRIDDNAAAHIKSALVGPSETVPIAQGKLLLGTWQNVFFCEFDGPRAERRVIVTVMG
ncbi:MAG: secondary thiamine-phosphate synthase enzyme YjbQ [Myxococcota bacterium]|nr:secondary thiamine-phosphate synthase enzyme YjbQ [Myxococcota bacterium]